LVHGAGLEPLAPLRDLDERTLMADEKKSEKVHGEPVTVKNPKVDKPIIGPDGHVILSKEDIDARAQ
jgi:hypothetical protein